MKVFEYPESKAIILGSMAMLIIVVPIANHAKNRPGDIVSKFDMLSMSLRQVIAERWFFSLVLFIIAAAIAEFTFLHIVQSQGTGLQKAYDNIDQYCALLSQRDEEQRIIEIERARREKEQELHNRVSPRQHHTPDKQYD